MASTIDVVPPNDCTGSSFDFLWGRFFTCQFGFNSWSFRPTSTSM
jgi:hypothetical protein